MDRSIQSALRVASWKALTTGFFSCLFLLATGCATQTAPALPREFRGAWVATVANIDWPTKPGLSGDEQHRQAIAILDQAVATKLNAILLQVRPCGDAMYPSPYEPWSEFLTGANGRSPTPAYDPLAMWIAEAHARGVELHAWFNPFRVGHPKERTAKASNHISRTRPDLVRRYDDLLWLDPGEQQAQDHALRVMLDVLGRYDIDGVVYDDYFYPYPQDKLDFPDAATYDKYRRAGGRLAKADWRRDNIDRFVQRSYALVKQQKKYVKFGISPFGIWKPENPPGIKGLSAYDSLYADARKWLNNGWLDYIAPQLYWPINQQKQAYGPLLDWWLTQNTKGRHVWPGNYASKIDATAQSWPAGEIVSQIHLTRSRAEKNATGNSLYSMVALKENRRGVTDALRTQTYAGYAAMPRSPWLSKYQPPKPTISPINSSTPGVIWSSPEPQNVWQWAVQIKQPNQSWTLGIYPQSIKFVSVPPGSTVVISALDRLGNESERATMVLK